jgi:DNA (cytosine-5)-methyltransferase 1
MLTVGSLFSGIGGIDLGLEAAGMQTRWFVEIDPHCRNVLARHWPGLPIYGDIADIDWSGVEPVDVLAGGFPCQPVSAAGKRAAQADPRWLWPEFARAIRALRPRYVLVENVADLLAVNGGSAVGDVLGDLAACGYDAEWDCIPAEAVGALHERDRLWIVAYASGVQPLTGGERTGSDATGHPSTRALSGRSKACAVLADTEEQSKRSRLRTSRTVSLGRRRPSDGSSSRIFSDADRESLGRLAESRGQRGQWATEPALGRVADGVPHRVDRLRALGNAVVPQVVEWIGRRIVAFDEGRVA